MFSVHIAVTFVTYCMTVVPSSSCLCTLDGLGLSHLHTCLSSICHPAPSTDIVRVKGLDLPPAGAQKVVTSQQLWSRVALNASTWILSQPSDLQSRFSLSSRRVALKPNPSQPEAVRIKVTQRGQGQRFTLPRSHFYIL